VLFPLEPQDDQRITGGKKYELKSRGGREAFVADDSSGHGTVLAAIAISIPILTPGSDGGATIPGGAMAAGLAQVSG
jgi:hypothetical protein